MQLLLVAAYFPLHSLANAERLLERSWPAPVEAVLTQQVREPLRELRLRADIPRLTGIENPVSRLVQTQYEENPYPRWVRPAPDTPDTIGNFLSSKFPFARFERPAGRALQDILIAGCGTGQRSIAMAQKFGAPHMLAVDLSLASLGYARRKSEELGLTIAYAQADILELERQADASSTSLKAWACCITLPIPGPAGVALLSLLRPGGFMLLGLYSEMARRPVLAARTRIAERVGGGAEDIRSFRQELIQSGDPRPYASILESEDFFSLSACRDLLFHVQEQRVTLAADRPFHPKPQSAPSRLRAGRRGAGRIPQALPAGQGRHRPGLLGGIRGGSSGPVRRHVYLLGSEALRRNEHLMLVFGSGAFTVRHMDRAGGIDDQYHADLHQFPGGGFPAPGQ